jgi:hypothetical protein
MKPKKTSDAYSRIYAVIRRIPHGRVATYGQIAAPVALLLGKKGAARRPPKSSLPGSESTSQPLAELRSAEKEVVSLDQPLPGNDARQVGYAQQKHAADGSRRRCRRCAARL